MSLLVSIENSEHAHFAVAYLLLGGIINLCTKFECSFPNLLMSGKS